jgi:hypothetical protein
MLRNYTLGTYQFFWQELFFLLLCLTFFVDMLTGFAIMELGINLNLSLPYKMMLLCLVVVLLAKYNIKIFLYLVCLLLISFVGPLYQFFDYVSSDFLFFDFSSLLKIFTPFLIFFFLRELFKHWPEMAQKHVSRFFTVTSSLLVANLILGAIGFGKQTYKLSNDESAGSTGLIMASNEVGPLFIICFGYFLHHIWNKNGLFTYILSALLTVAFGLVVATKAAMLASLLLIFFIPLVNERERLLQLTKLKVYIVLPLILAVSIIGYLLMDILKAIGLYDKITFFYQQHGLIGVLLSGRDAFLYDKLEILNSNSNYFEQFFGQGQALKLKSLHNSAATELDFFDILHQFGFIPSIFAFIFYISITGIAFVQTIRNKSYVAPYVLCVSFILLCLSQLSGHVWYGGVASISLGVFCSMIYFKNNADTKINSFKHSIKK